jgi:chromosomal replication initiation ATPase DnaA
VTLTEDPPLLDDILANLDDRGLLHLVIEAAAKEKVTRYDVVSRIREASAVRARRSVIRRLYVEFEKSTPEIGRLLCLDHTTILHALCVAGVKRRPAFRRRVA